MANADAAGRRGSARGRRRPASRQRRDLSAPARRAPARSGRGCDTAMVRQAWRPVRPGIRRSCRRAHRGGKRLPPCWPRSGCPARSARSRPPTACTRRCWMRASSRLRLIPAVKEVGDGGLLLPLGVRRLRSYGPARNARYCFTRVTASDRIGRRGRSRCSGRARDGSAQRARAADGHRCRRGQRTRACAGRRLLTIDWQQRALPARARHRTRHLAADRDLRRRRCPGNRAHRVAEIPWCAM